MGNFKPTTTCCVLSMHFSKHYVNRITATNSFFIFSPFNLLRKTCIALVTNQYPFVIEMCKIRLLNRMLSCH
uniref:Uncharacterized protein n=1 Tax=Strigamia maritima TaxID=126957 RepID=T1JNJ9_STRMM